jgi:hypothetical protein
MPTVQLYGSRKIGPAALPGARLTAHETPESQGAGVAEADAQRGEALGNIGQRAASIGTHLYAEHVDQEKQRADQVALMEAENKLSEWENDRLYNPGTGALNLKGKNAMGLPETVGGEYKDFASSVQEGLTTPRQKEAFAVVAGRRGQSLDLTLQRHVFGEISQYEQGELTKLIDNKKTEAVQNAADPRRVGIALNDALDAFTSSAPRLGIGPQEIEAGKRSITSATHVGVVEQLLATNQTKQAKVYFDEAKGAISGDQLPRLEKALQEGDVRKQSQQQADTIIAAGGTLSEQRAKARQIDDPEVRDSVMARLEHEDAVNEKEQREAAETAMKGVYNIVDKTHDVNSIPPTTWASLTGPQRSSIREYSDRLARGLAVETDIPTYYGLMQKAADDPTTFSTTNLLNYRGRLGDTEFKSLTGLQLSIRNGDRKAAEEAIGGFRTHDQIIKDSLTQYGIDPTPKEGTKEAAAVAELRRRLDANVADLTNSTGKKASNTDIQAQLDKILGTQVNVPGSWWGLLPFNGISFRDSNKRIIDLTIDDVPAPERQEIEAAMKRKNRTATDATILDAYVKKNAAGPK